MLTTAILMDRWRRTREGTLALVRAIPAGQFEWRPSERAFSCGDLVRHLMQAERVFRRIIESGVRQEPWDPWRLEGPGEERLRGSRERIRTSAADARFGTTPDACLARWREIQAETDAALSNVPDAALAVEVEHPLAAFRAPVWEMFLFMIEHEIHHRGQLSAYLKALDVDQPANLLRQY